MANGTSANAKRLLWAGFFSIFAAGVGFGVRSSVLVDWGHQFGFTQKELGDISGGGLWGFGLVVIAGCLLADRIGYGKLMIFAFVMHIASAGLQLCTEAVFDGQFAPFFPKGKEGVKESLTWAMIMFSIANGTCEVVVNPMVAALFPKEKTHYLNILHAGWPGGLILGGLIGYFATDVFPIPWMVQMSLFLVPVAIYALMMAGQHFPRSEASQAGIPFSVMLAQFAAPMLLLLLLIHALVGYVELGTDSWIGKITGSIIADRGAGMLLFVYTSGLMFALRFVAGPIEHALSPLGLLFSCAIIAAIGLTLLAGATGVLYCLLAVTVYGIGKTFFWPTMLAVVSERFPRGGAITIGAIGGVGMLSAGLLGVPGIGYNQDYYAASQLKNEDPPAYERYAAEKPNRFLGIFESKGLDQSKVNLLELERDVLKPQDAVKKIDEKLQDPGQQAEYAALREERKKKEKALKGAEKELDTALTNLRESTQPEHKALLIWWDSSKAHVIEDATPVANANLFGGRMALQWTALVPAIMAVLYLLLIVYFRLKGGYKKVTIDDALEHALESPGSAEA